MKNILRYYLLMLLTISVVSCNDIDDVNINHNDPESVPVDNLFLGVQKSMSHRYAQVAFDNTSKLIQHTVWPNKDWSVLMSPDADEYWLRHFDQIRNIDYIIDNSSQVKSYHKAVALVMKSWMYYNLTSLHGDVPYSEATKAKEGTLRPAYDKQEDVFKGLLADLTEANSLFNEGRSSKLTGDFLLSNDVVKWRKFANSLKVRILIAQSKQIDPSVELKKMLGDAVMYPLMESNDDQPEFNYKREFDFPRSKSDYAARDVFLCKELVDKMNENDDQRIKAFASFINDASQTYVGIEAGFIGSVDDRNKYSNVSPLILESTDHQIQQTVWMSYAELEFLLAEAAERGWINGGTDLAKEHYNKGIEASYEYWSNIVSAGIADGVGGLVEMDEWDPAYLVSEHVKYGGDKLDKIATQKWIALYMDMENYYSWRRQALPELKINPEGPNKGIIPLRFQYPEEEKGFNEANYDNAVKAMGGDDWATKMWLIK